jgi:hypothetical protein
MPNVAAEWLALLLHIWVVIHTNLVQGLTILVEVYYDFHKTLQANCEILP